MAEILSIRRKTLSNQSINQSYIVFTYESCHSIISNLLFFYILALICGIEISKVIGEPKTEVILTSNPLQNGNYNVSRGFVYGHIWSIVYQAYRVVSFLSCRSFM